MSKNNLYDVIIIGAGPSGIFCAYELIRQKPELKILMVEKGRPIEKRVCPKRTTKVCVGCMCPPSPALMTGTEAARDATRAAPSFGWRIATTST